MDLLLIYPQAILKKPTQALLIQSQSCFDCLPKKIEFDICCGF